jgi:hypothetical protein
MRSPGRLTAVASVGLAATLATAGIASGAFTPRADPLVVDPDGSGIVRSVWRAGAGLRDASGPLLRADLTAPGVEVGRGLRKTAQKRFGLVLEKNGATATNAVAMAELRGVKGITITELGYDIRSDTHCGGASPRFNVSAEDGNFFFVGNCSLSSRTDLGNGWTRVRMTSENIFPISGPAPASLVAMGPIRSIAVAFDEGVDAALSPPSVVTPGRTVIDNIAVNGRLITRPGPAR